MNKKVRFGIIGCGVIGPAHAESIKKLDNAELVAVCDIIEDRAKKMAEKFGVKNYYINYHDLLNRDDIDVVSVCVPSGLHGDITIDAAKAGKNVLCEKPLDINKEKMTAMIKACRDNGVKLGCVFQRRTMLSAIKAREAIREGKLGKIVMANAYLKYFRSQAYYDSEDWRGTWELDGGGALMNQGIHGIDLIQWMVGEVDSVFAYADHLVRNIEVEDTAVVAMKYKNGAFGVIEGATSVFEGEETVFEIHGDKGTIIFGDSGIKKWKTEEGEVSFDTGEAMGGSRGPEISSFGHLAVIKDMVDAIINDREPMVPGEEGRKAVDLILAIYESVRTKREVKVS